jgi:hypothetical protein
MIAGEDDPGEGKKNDDEGMAPTCSSSAHVIFSSPCMLGLGF